MGCPCLIWELSVIERIFVAKSVTNTKYCVIVARSLNIFLFTVREVRVMSSHSYQHSQDVREDSSPLDFLAHLNHPGRRQLK